MDSKVEKLSDVFDKVSIENPAFDDHLILRSITEEIVTPIDGKLSGKIPEWLEGSLLMNGPGTFTIGDHKLNHLFDGMAVLQKFNISSLNGKITYQNKMLQSEAYTKGCEKNKIMFGEFGTTATAQSLFKKVMNIGKPAFTDNALVTIYPISGNYYAMTEAPTYYKIDPATLDTLERVDLANKLEIFAITAHPHIMKDGMAFNVGVSMNKGGSVYNIICFPKGENIVDDAIVVAKIPSRFKYHPSYMHSFGITKNYFIIYETPLVISVPLLIKSSIITTTFMSCMKWLEGESTRIILVDRATNTLSHTFYAEPFMCFHTINQFEKDDHVIFDLVCYKNGDIVDALTLENLAKNDVEQLKKFTSLAFRFVMPTVAENKNVNLVNFEGSTAKATLMDDGKIHCTPELLSNFGCEFPRVNYPLFSGIEYKYFYASGRDGSIIKVDTRTKEKIIWKEEKNFSWEPIFVPSPKSEDEDDGVIVAGFLSSDAANKVGLIILDAKNLQQIAKAEFTDLPTTITKPFHGWFVASE